MLSFKHLAFLSLGVLLASCSVIYDDEGDCDVHYRVRFSSAYNLNYADAFAHEVDEVTLYIFDADGHYVTSLNEQSADITAAGQSLELPPLPAGRYTLVAWGGLEGELQSYEVPDLQAGTSTLDDLTCRVGGRTRPGDGSAHVGELDELFHGRQTFDLTAQEGTHILDLPLMKNTKHVRVVLQNLSGEPVPAGDFTFAITDDNGLMASDNSLLPDELLTFDAWHVSQGVASMDTAGETAGQAGTREGTTALSVAVAELTTCRLMAGQTDNRTTLTVTRSVDAGDGDTRQETVLSIPLVDYALLVKGHYNEGMDDQEYLDRQDEYNLTFFLDDNNDWLSASIIINSWRVVLSDVEL